MLDTNVLSELRRPSPFAGVVTFLAACPLDQLFISVVTLAEIRFGIASVGDSGRREVLENWLELRVRPMFAGRVLPITEDIMLKWRLMVEEGRRVGHTFSQPDLIIAATAIHHGLTVVTRDLTHFEKAHVPIINPWDTP